MTFLGKNEHHISLPEEEVQGSPPSLSGWVGGVTPSGWRQNPHIPISKTGVAGVSGSY